MPHILNVKNIMEVLVMVSDILQWIVLVLIVVFIGAGWHTRKDFQAVINNIKQALGSLLIFKNRSERLREEFLSLKAHIDTVYQKQERQLNDMLKLNEFVLDMDTIVKTIRQDIKQFTENNRTYHERIVDLKNRTLEMERTVDEYKEIISNYVTSNKNIYEDRFEEIHNKIAKIKESLWQSERFNKTNEK